MAGQEQKPYSRVTRKGERRLSWRREPAFASACGCQHHH
ncbi:hypothetical protein CCACVL1_11478 [Corchorus capsularis]|uniref:Uncharacterized protein n=1 Tax=Corchorus capsularis TaxID=210143 RepID=A0A1R3IL26_COCAP|nr:hypothetical protein CCACVL1_11478 [Corchorus capsularis]